MKRLTTCKILAIMCLLMLWMSCTKDESSSDPINPSNSVVSGNWSISNFRQRTEDKTSQYVGYNFSFASNGTVTATKGSSVTNGTWAYSPTSGTSYTGIFSLNMGNDDPLKRLNESWRVDAGQSNPNQLKLTHPEAADDEHVTFSK